MPYFNIWQKIAAIFCVLFLLPMTALASDWTRYESKNFIIYSDVNKTDSIEYLRKLESFYTITEAFYLKMGDSTFPLIEKPTFYYFRNVAQFHAVRPSLERNAFNPFTTCFDGDQFFTSAEMKDIAPALPKNLYKNYNGDLIYLFMAYDRLHQKQSFSSPIPSWAKNGLNYYFMTTQITDQTVTLGIMPPDISTADENGSTIDLRLTFNALSLTQILNGSVKNGSYSSGFIFNSWILTHYLLSDQDLREKFYQYLQAVENGSDPQEAFKTIIGLTDSDYLKIFKAYNSKGYSIMTYNIKAIADSDIAMSTLPSYTVDIPLLYAASKNCLPKRDGENLLIKLRSNSLKFPNDDLSQRALARAEISFGDPNIALTIATNLLSNNPDDPELTFILGHAQLAIAESLPLSENAKAYALARSTLGKAYKLNPTSSPVLYYFARSNANQANFPDENTLNAIALANDYSLSGYYMYQAELYVRAGKNKEALDIIARHKGYNNPGSDTYILLSTIASYIESGKSKDEILSQFSKYWDLP